ncbi:hypothetical protein J6590_029979 [Homalodisca vitripennis]|nr:hypothetical protein J6590_029979 [Homalodisca vitripennis]
MALTAAKADWQIHTDKAVTPESQDIIQRCSSFCWNDAEKGKPALNQPLQSKQAGRCTPLCLPLQEPLTLRERTRPTPTVISRSRLDLSNYSFTPESRISVSDMILLDIHKVVQI